MAKKIEKSESNPAHILVEHKDYDSALIIAQAIEIEVFVDDTQYCQRMFWVAFEDTNPEKVHYVSEHTLWEMFYDRVRRFAA